MSAPLARWLAATLAAVGSITGAAVAIANADTSTPTVVSVTPATGHPKARDLNIARPVSVLALPSMPRSIVVDRVTLGNFASAASCRMDANVDLVLYEVRGRGSRLTRIARSRRSQSLPARLGHVSWGLSAVRLSRAHAYVLAIVRSGPGCGRVVEQSGPHKSHLLDAGTAACAPLGNVSEDVWRLWHERGRNDSWRCPPLRGLARIDAGTGTGWRAVHAGRPASAIQGADPLCASAGGSAAGSSCRLTRFAPPGKTVPGGWHYALPLNAAPRDLYVRLAGPGNAAPTSGAVHENSSPSLQASPCAARSCGRTPSTRINNHENTVSSAYQQAVAADGPVSYWPLGDAVGSSTAADIIGGDDLTTAGAVTFAAAGPDANQTAASFSGGGSLVTNTAPPTGTNVWTLEARVKPSSLNQNGGIVYDGDVGATNGFGTLVSGCSAPASESSGGCLVGLYDSQGWVPASGSTYTFPDTTSWHQVAITADGTSTYLYVDGNRAATGTEPVAAAPTGLTIGAAATRYFQGTVSDVAVYDKNLTQGQIQAHYNAWVGGPVNTTAPAISGNTTDAQTLTASTGSWTGSPTSYSYQWESCDSSGSNCADLAGSTSQTYALSHGDVGTTLRVVVTAANAQGSTSATSTQTQVVQAVPSCQQSTVQPCTTYETAIAGDGPVAQFQFQDQPGATSLFDAAGNFTASNNAITLGAPGAINGSSSGAFNGSSSYAALPQDPLDGDATFSAEAWVYWTGGSAWQRIFDLGAPTASGDNTVYLSASGGTSPGGPVFEVHTADGTDFRAQGPTLTQNAWHYLAATEDASGTLTLYEDGQQAAQTTGATINPATIGATTENWLGRSTWSSTDPYFGGRLQDVAFYSYALSAVQVRAHYLVAFSAPSNTSLPSVSGSAMSGHVLTASAGS